jgi:prolyl 4-hydroxylase
MTGLTQTTAEAIQVQNYGIGGHYVPHWDHTIPGDDGVDDADGNRIATMLFYVSQVSGPKCHRT